MDKKRLLIAEDDAGSAHLMKEYLGSSGYEISIADNGIHALDSFTREPFPVVITDIEMPEMDGREFISRIRAFPAEPVIIVTTVHDTPSTIIDIMKGGVFDYLIKPIDLNDLLIKLERAFDVSELKRARMLLEKEKIIRIENQLEWYRWEERIKTRGTVQTGKTLLESLKTSFNQGYGFGSLVTLIDILSSSAVKTEDSYQINAELFDILKENSKMSAFALRTFGEISDIISRDLDLETVSCVEVFDFIESVIQDARAMAEFKNQRILLSEKKMCGSGLSCRINKPYLKKAVYEVLMNTLKFSEENSSVLVIFDFDDESFIINILNVPAIDGSSRRGIPAEFENIIFEPFFRLSKTIQESYATLDFGLGLTIVETIIAKHGGKTSICNIIDHSNIAKGPTTRVKFTMTLPLRR